MTAENDDVPLLSPEIREWLVKERAKVERCKLTVTVGGETVPLKDCDWVLREPCGCVSAITSAVTGSRVLKDAEAAWHALYDADGAPKRVREEGIKQRKAYGCTVEAMLLHDAVEAFQARCTHTRGGRSVEDTPGI